MRDGNTNHHIVSGLVKVLPYSIWPLLNGPGYGRRDSSAGGGPGGLIAQSVKLVLPAVLWPEIFPPPEQKSGVQPEPITIRVESEPPTPVPVRVSTSSS